MEHLSPSNTAGTKSHYVATKTKNLFTALQTLPMHLTAHGHSDVGRKRTNNEDSLLLTDLAASAHPDATSLSAEASLTLSLAAPGVLLAVSDGLGGCNAGEVASSLALTTLRGLLAAPAGLASTSERFLKALHDTDRAIRAAAKLDPARAGMGATLTALWLDGAGGAWLGQIGDSRLYRLRDGILAQLSPEHSPVGRMREQGLITEEESHRHRYRSMIDQSLGGDPATFAPEVIPIDLAPGDIVLLCSDGLTDGLRDADLTRLLLPLADGKSTPSAACAAVIEAGNAASGRDNITALVAQLSA